MRGLVGGCSHSTLRTGRLAEIRTLLGVLRSDDHDALAPVPNLADLWRLAAEIRDAGLPVDLELALLPALPPGVELAGYRIVQEALTNALRHAHARLATVRLETIPGALRIVVRDDGQGPGAGRVAGGGHGLIGMRERVAVYGVSFTAGPSPGGGFEVEATLPFDRGRS